MDMGKDMIDAKGLIFLLDEFQFVCISGRNSVLENKGVTSVKRNR
jgi:hypothetical protein